MKKTVTYVTAGILVLAVGIVVLKGRKVSAKSLHKASDSQPCYTKRPEHFPKAASADAPVALVNLQGSPAQLYAQIQLLTRSERLRFFNALSGTNKAKVWAVHIQNFAMDHDLSVDQQAWLDFIVGALKGVDYDHAEAFDAKLRSANFKARTLELFTKEDAWEIAGHLGGKFPYASNQQQVHFLAPTITDWEAPICECNYPDDWCTMWYGPAYSCAIGDDRWCKGSLTGCGWFGREVCDGRCMIQ